MLLLQLANYADLSNKPILFDGTWASLTGKPTTIVGYGITDFEISGATTNDLIKFNGSKWVKFSPNFALTTHTHSDATTIESGFLSVVDKTELDNLKNVDGYETKIVAGTNISISGSGTNADPYNINATNTSNNQYYIGQLKDGGIIFYIYRDSDGLEHGFDCFINSNCGNLNGKILQHQHQQFAVGMEPIIQI